MPQQEVTFSEPFSGVLCMTEKNNYAIAVAIAVDERQGLEYTDGQVAVESSRARGDPALKRMRRKA